MRLKTRLLGVLMAALFAAPLAANATLITYDFNWSGADGYSMTGWFSFDDANAADGAIRDGEVASLFFQGFYNGQSIGAMGAAPTRTGFNFNFDAVAGQFFLNGFSSSNDGQLWNFGSFGGLGFGSGSAASALTMNGNVLAMVDNPVPLSATRRGAATTVPEPATLGLFGLAAAFAFSQRRREKAATK